MITVIGLGTEPGDLTERALTALKSADRVLIRNTSPVSEALRAKGLAFETLDGVYAKSRNFDTLAKNLAAEVKKYEKENVCYAVEGGVTEDRAALLLIERGGVRVIEGVSKAARAAARAGFSGGYTAVSAYGLEGRTLTLPLVVYDLDDRLVAGDVKLRLTELFGDEARALFLGGEERNIALYETDMQEEYDALTALAVYEIPLLEKSRFSFDDFVAILKRLRAPDGCPWDRVQTHESIRINAIEEAYELVDAIDLADEEKMLEEAGDVLMQAVFHALIEEEKGSFSVTDVVSEVCKKLISRHTHVFGTDRASGAESALSVWDKNKMTEKHQATFSDAINDIPECFPALLRAQKFAKRAAKGGWNFSSMEACRHKLDEEYEELLEALKRGDETGVREELGDVLMVIAWIAYNVKSDAEMALLDTVKKNAKRYNVWEKLVLSDGKDVNSLTDEEWHYYYRKMKEVCKK